jgi:endonuclease YncB( thermonuclease family)
MNQMLAGVLQHGTGKGAALERPAAGKTGTTSDYRDALFVGYTPELVCGVWFGNDDNSPMKKETGGDLPAKIFHDFMVAADQVKSDGAAAPEPAAPPAPPPPPAAPGPSPAASAPGVAAAVPPAPDGGSGAVPAGTERPAPVRGVPAVVDTATLRFGRQLVRLYGVEGEGGRFARELALYLGNREVTCEPVGSSAERCRVDGYDLAELVVFNGGGRATPDAPPRIQAVEDEARRARRGIWRY